MKHIHHKIPRSRGGTDDEWNLVEIDPYTHAYEHALDFVLFEHAPWFDCRQQGWPLLPEDLKKAVLLKMSQKAKQRGFPWEGKEHLTEEHKQKIAAALRGKKKTDQHRENFRLAVLGRKAPNKGVPHSEETKKKISEAKKGKPAWNKGLKKNAS